MSGLPVAAVLAGMTAAVGWLVRLSLFPLSSVNVTVTVSALPTSEAAGV